MNTIKKYISFIMVFVIVEEAISIDVVCQLTNSSSVFYIGMTCILLLFSLLFIVAQCFLDEE